MDIPSSDHERAVYFAARLYARPYSYRLECYAGCGAQLVSREPAMIGWKADHRLAVRAVKAGWQLDAAGHLGCPACSAKGAV